MSYKYENGEKYAHMRKPYCIDAENSANKIPALWHHITLHLLGSSSTWSSSSMHSIYAILIKIYDYFFIHSAFQCARQINYGFGVYIFAKLHEVPVYKVSVYACVWVSVCIGWNYGSLARLNPMWFDSWLEMPFDKLWAFSDFIYSIFRTLDRTCTPHWTQHTMWYIQTYLIEVALCINPSQPKPFV